MSLYLGRAGRKIINYINSSLRANRLVNAFGRVAHKVTFGSYTPGLTRETVRLFQATSAGDNVEIRADGFYLSGQNIAGNHYISTKLKSANSPDSFQRKENDTPESLTRSFHLAIEQTKHSLRRHALSALGGTLAMYALNQKAFVESLDRSTELQEAITPSANFYGCFSMHDGSRTLPISTIMSLSKKEPSLIIVPEGPFKFTTEDKHEIDAVLPRDPFLGEAGGRYLQEQRTPFLLADVMVGRDPAGFLAPDNFNKSFQNYHNLMQAESILTASTAVAVGKSARRVSRRGFMTTFLGAATVAGAQPFLLPNFLNQFSDVTDWFIKFRNLVVAAKILTLAEMLKKQGKEKPAFLVLMGTKHQGIMQQLATGLDKNLALLRKYQPEAARQFGPLWSQGYLFDEANNLGVGNNPVIQI